MPHSPDLLYYLETITSRAILVVGDIMLDRFTYGEVSRISPEAPIPVLRYQREVSMLGGAGNVVRNLVSLGQKADIIAVIGADAVGFEMANMLAQHEGITPHLLTDAARPSTVKSRFIAGGQQMLRLDHEENVALAPALEAQLAARLRLALQAVDAIILSDYAKGVLTPAVIQETLALAKQAGKPVIIDPKFGDYRRYAGAAIITPNRKELAEASGMAINQVADAVAAANQLIREYQFGAVLAKLGGDGLCLVRPQHPPLHCKANSREVYDVSGAGDTVVAAFATALVAGIPMEQAAMLANHAGSLVVGKTGTATVTLEELSHNLRHAETQAVETKVVARAAAVERVERWRRQGLRVGFTNGCFDLLHPGHIALLQQARQACDRLVLGLNSDASVKRLKGDTRPIQNEWARSHVIAALEAIHLVVVFEEDTPLELIKTLRPEVLIKGADYTEAQVVGAAEVKSWGGQVVLATLVDGQSTTRTVGKIKQFGT